MVSVDAHIDVRGVSTNKSGEGKGNMSEKRNVTESGGFGRGKRNKNKKRKQRAKQG